MELVILFSCVLAILFHYRDNVGCPCWVLFLTIESNFFEFIHLLFDFRYQFRVKMPLWLFVRCSHPFQWISDGQQP